jgi:hypothetical protein
VIKVEACETGAKHFDLRILENLKYDTGWQFGVRRGMNKLLIRSVLQGTNNWRNIYYKRRI